MLTQRRLKEVLHYNPDNGEFRWAYSRVGVAKGSLAGANVNGYVAIRIDYQRYLAHRLAFLYMTGKIPVEVDHRNRIRSDNKWSNLRKATRSQNHANASAHSRNTSGVKGVCWHKFSGTWWAYINWHGRRQSLGNHKTLAAAAAARQKAERELFGEFQPQ